MSNYIPVIGLEIHVELKTKSKMFCQCSGDYFGKKPNTNTCPVCLGMPGALPVPNRQAVEWTIKIGQALNCVINKQTKFDRKHYYYPDLPKGYQISQYDEPIAVNGKLEIVSKHPPTLSPPSRGEHIQSPIEGRGPEGGGVFKTIGITRVHLEEDTGKLTHAGDDTLVDFNRSSVPLVEIVTEPDFDNPEDVKIFLEELHTIIRTLEVSDADMEKGSMRMEPNISLSTIQNYELRIKKLPPYKVEVKNINSFNFAKKAIEYELIRQAKILDTGETPTQETRGYNENKGITYSQRSKEEAQDYRYFPEPDIPPLVFDDALLETIRSTIPELPAAKMKRYVGDYKLRHDDAFIMTRDVSVARFFEAVVKQLQASDVSVPEKIRHNLAQTVANVLVNKRIPTTLSAEAFIQRFLAMYQPVEVDEDRLTQVIESVLDNNQPQVVQYKAGKTGLIGFFVGQVMKEMKGQADAATVHAQLVTKLQ